MTNRRFCRVTVALSEAEYQQLRSEAALQPRGTVSEVIREKMGMQPAPYGYLKYLVEQDAIDKAWNEAVQ